MSLWEALLDAVRGQGIDLPPTVTHETRLDNLGADSLDLIEVLMTLEERYALPVGFFDEQGFAGSTLGEAEAFLTEAFVRQQYTGRLM